MLSDNLLVGMVESVCLIEDRLNIKNAGAGSFCRVCWEI